MPLTERALRTDELVLTPCYLAGGHGHIVALPGMLSVAIGTEGSMDMAHQRAAAERLAHDSKLLSDPTRVLILTELDRAPSTVGAIAERVGVAQPTASVHVRQLREAGLLCDARRQQHSYRVERHRLREARQSAQESLLPMRLSARRRRMPCTPRRHPVESLARGSNARTSAIPSLSRFNGEDAVHDCEQGGQPGDRQGDLAPVDPLSGLADRISSTPSSQPRLQIPPCTRRSGYRAEIDQFEALHELHGHQGWDADGSWSRGESASACATPP